MQPSDEAPGGPSAEAAAPTPDHSRSGLAGRVRRTAEWGRQKYIGSSAQDLRQRLEAVDVVSQGMLFAATLLVCFLPFLIVVAALSGRTVTDAVARHTGLNEKAAADASRLFASDAATTDAVAGTTSMVFFVLGGIAAATALQQLYERVFDLDRRGMRDTWRRLVWLAALFVVGLAGGWIGPELHHAGGPVLLGVVGLVGFTAFWWITMRILIGRRVSGRRLLAPACATGVFWLGMQVAFSIFFSDMVISDYDKYGAIGVVFALMTYLIAIGVVVILGAVVGLVWQERHLSFAAAVAKLRHAR